MKPQVNLLQRCIFILDKNNERPDWMTDLKHADYAWQKDACKRNLLYLLIKIIDLCNVSGGRMENVYSYIELCVKIIKMHRQADSQKLYTLINIQKKSRRIASGTKCYIFVPMQLSILVLWSSKVIERVSHAPSPKYCCIIFKTLLHLLMK